MAFDPSQFGATPVSQGSSGGGFDPTQFGATPVANQAAQASTQPKQSIADQIWSGLAGAGSQIAGAFQGGVNQMKQGYQQAQLATNPIQKTEAGMSMLSGGVGAALSPLAPALAPVSSAIQSAGNALSDNPLIKGAAGNQVIGPGGVATYVPNTVADRVPRDINNTANVLPLAAGAIAPREIAGAAQDTASSISDMANSIAERQKASAVAREQAVKVDNHAKLQSVADEWQQPTIPGKSTNPASFNKASSVLARDPGTPMFLAEQKLSPANHIENGRYATEDSASALRETAGQMSRDTLRPSLQMADYSTPKTPVAEITKEAIANASKDPNVTPGDLATIVRNTNKEAAALSKQFPDGMSLTDMHDYKITYAKNGGYKPIGTVADNNTAAMNRNFSSALGTLVEKKAPPALPVGDFNAYLGKYYKAADYLDALNTKKAPVSLMQNVAHRASQVTGAVLGHGIGGGLLGGVGGYMIGGALEHAVENMTLPMRDSFLQNLKITQPEAFTKVKAYLNDPNAGMLQLEAPKDGGVIRLGPSTEPGPSVAPYAKKAGYPLARDPKTGRVMRTYTSSPQ